MKKPPLPFVLWSSVGILAFGLLIARIFAPAMLWLTVAILVALAAVLGVLIKENRKALTGRTAAYGANSLITAVIVIAIVGVLNFLGVRYPKKIDLTQNRVHSVSDQTEKVMKSLQTDVQAILFAKMAEREKFKPLLDNYKSLSPKFLIEYVDPDKEPLRAKQLGIKRYNTLNLTYGDKTAQVVDVTEEKLTNELIKLTKDKRQKLCWITGHGEKILKSAEQDGYETARQGLEKQSYEIEELSIAEKQGKIPETCSAIAIIGPNKSFLPVEKQAIDSYLDGGGRAVIALETNLDGRDAAPDLAPVLKKWKITPLRGLIVDPSSLSYGVDLSALIVQLFNRSHPITKDFKVGAMLVLPQALQMEQSSPEIAIDWLARTKPEAWSEMNFAELKKGQIRRDGADTPGPLTLAAIVEGKQKDSKAARKTRLAVLGSAQFANNNYSRFMGNLDLFLNSVSWVLEDESLISIRAKADTSGKIEISQAQGTFIFWISVVILPLLIVIGGIVVWVRRRKL